MIQNALFKLNSQPDNMSWDVGGETGDFVDIKDYGVWEPYAVSKLIAPLYI